MLNDICTTVPGNFLGKRLSSTVISLKIISICESFLPQKFPYKMYTGRQSHVKIYTRPNMQSYMYLSSATQMWCLARLLPLIIGSEIPTDNGHWYNFLLLLEMLDYIFAPTITPTAVAQLKVLINEHNSAFTSLYPTCSVTPKMHYIVHYPDLILR